MKTVKLFPKNLMNKVVSAAQLQTIALTRIGEVDGHVTMGDMVRFNEYEPFSAHVFTDGILIIGTWAQVFAGTAEVVQVRHLDDGFFTTYDSVTLADRDLIYSASYMSSTPDFYDLRKYF